jgi:AcrR family transcriptional regulator
MPVQKTDRDAIVQVALACFKRNGFHHTSMAAIAEEAGLLKGSLYHYFNDKDALALAAVEWVHTHFREHVFSHARRDDRTPAQRWRAMWRLAGKPRVWSPRCMGCSCSSAWKKSRCSPAGSPNSPAGFSLNQTIVW